MLKIAICDDADMADKIKEDIEKLGKKNKINLQIDDFCNGYELVECYQEGNCYDIIFLEIMVLKMDVIEMAKKIRKYDNDVLFIIHTYNKEFIQKSFEARPFRYLVKPTSNKEFEDTFLAAYQEVASKVNNYIGYQYKKKFYRIPIKEILYFESRKRKVMIITKDYVGIMYGKLNDIENMLTSGKEKFIRVHQSFLINYMHIQIQANKYIIMDNGATISISEERRKYIRECFSDKKYVIHIN